MGGPGCAGEVFEEMGKGERGKCPERGSKTF